MNNSAYGAVLDTETAYWKGIAPETAGQVR